MEWLDWVQPILVELSGDQFEVATGITSFLWPIGRVFVHAARPSPRSRLKLELLGGDMFKGLAILPFALLATTIFFKPVGETLVDHHPGIVAIAGAFALAAAMGKDAQSVTHNIVEGLGSLFDRLRKRFGG